LARALADADGLTVLVPVCNKHKQCLTDWSWYKFASFAKPGNEFYLNASPGNARLRPYSALRNKLRYLVDVFQYVVVTRQESFSVIINFDPNTSNRLDRP